MCKCLQKGFGPLLQLTVWLSLFPAGVMALDKNNELFFLASVPQATL